MKNDPKQDILDLYDNNFFAARKKLLHNDPFYAQMVYQCAVEMNEEVGTISIKEHDGTIYLIYSEEWVNQQTVDGVIESIKHVLNHLIFGHLNNQAFNVEDKRMDIAQDLAINTCLNQDKLPEGFYKPSDYNLPEDLSTYDYFYKVPDQGGKEDDPNNDGTGGVGSGTGDGNGNGKTGDNHQMMSKTVSESQLQKQVKQMVQQADNKSGGRTAGQYGSGIAGMLKFLLAPPEIPWAQVLRQFISFSSKVKRVLTWKRPNRRFGEEMQGRKKVQTLKILVAIDESGSVSADEWKRFLAEIDGILKTKLAEVTICKFTTKVEEVFEYTGQEKDKMFERHYGGTGFQPFLDLAEEMKPDAVICLTDGENCEGDNIKYSRMGTVLWVLTPQHRKPKHGQSVVIKDLRAAEDMYW